MIAGIQTLPVEAQSVHMINEVESSHSWSILAHMYNSNVNDNDNINNSNGNLVSVFK